MILFSSEIVQGKKIIVFINEIIYEVYTIFYQVSVIQCFFLPRRMLLYHKELLTKSETQVGEWFLTISFHANRTSLQKWLVFSKRLTKFNTSIDPPSISKTKCRSNLAIYKKYWPIVNDQHLKVWESTPGGHSTLKWVGCSARSGERCV